VPFLVLLVLAFAPGELTAKVLRSQRRVQARAKATADHGPFALGAAVTIPVVLVEVVFLGESSLSDEVTLGALAVAMLLVVGPA
jgi:hypothetical protein